MPIRFSASGRVFAPTWPMTLLTLVLLMLFVSLGRWQWQRGVDRQAQWEQFEQAPTPMLADTTPDFDSLSRFSRVAFTARLQATHQFLLDNRMHGGKPGFEVLTPALLNNGERVLVNRGWIPFSGFRDRLPDVSLPPTGRTTIVGRIDELPSPGLASGRAPPDTSAQWPKLTSFPTHEELQRALGEKISRRVVLLDPGIAGYGDFVREWSPPGLAPARHFSYAIQWWGFAVVLLVLYFGLNFRKVT